MFTTIKANKVPFVACEEVSGYAHDKGTLLKGWPINDSGSL